MGNTPYGLTALMETINNIEAEEENLDAINDIASGTTETVTYMDAVETGFMKDKVDVDDEVEVDDDADDFIDDVDENDPTLNRMIENIDEDEEEEVGLENLDAALESYINGDEGGY